MSSSDDDMPLVKGGRSKPNGNTNGVNSSKYISKQTDAAMDKEVTSKIMPTAGLSIRNGPMDMDIDDEKPNGHLSGVANGKRKARLSAGKHVSYKDDSDDEPLTKRRRTSMAALKVPIDDSDDEPLAKSTKKPPKMEETLKTEGSDSDEPLGEQLAKVKAKIHKAANKTAKQIRKKEELEDDAVNNRARAKKKLKAPGSTSKGAVKVNGVKGASASTKINAAIPKRGKGKAAIREEQTEAEEEEEEEHRWWDNMAKGDGSNKWKTLEHNGVVFPPEYEPLPSNVKLLYEGKPVKLAPEAEEVAGFFGTMLSSEVNVGNPVFCKNFFKDFQAVLKETGGATVKGGSKIELKDFDKCDFNPIFDYYEMKRQEKKALPAAEKKKIKVEKDEMEAPYLYCQWDGRKEKVGNFRVEPPGLFRGRGDHPKTGMVKKRVFPEQITINIGEGTKVPVPPKGHKWKEVKHDQEGTWLAMWQENINNAYKYVMLAANSSIKGQSDYNKFEKARELKKHVDRIRRDYTRELKSELTADRQRATAVYLIDQFALRAGNEKSDQEADTVGVCSLRVEHVTLKPPNVVIFDFLGKDSIRFYDEVTVTPQVFKNLKIFKKPPKSEGDEIFDRLTTTQLNKHLTSYMPGLTAKVFRTYNASNTFATLLKDLKQKNNVAEMIQDYNAANRKVAILCNHKRTVGAAHETQMEKMGDKVKGLQYQQWRLRQQMLALEPKLKKKRGADFFALPEDLDDEWILEHHTFLVDEMKTKIEKKFGKDNEALLAEGKREMKPKELHERLEPVRDLEKKLKKEHKTKKVEVEGRSPTVEKVEASIEKLELRINTMRAQAADKEDNKEVALGTSKINYIDPRLTAVFCKKFNVPIEKFFSKTLREKFDWAFKSADEDWEF
ncbi:MAG: DNA topoisomerase 1 [Vezdaea aestivalis]|nr:MAG: DNA topoisomerase 1 [Vezdaea aestivalis]